MARKAGGASKSKAIRDYKAGHKAAGPTAIAAALTSDGITVSPQFVSTVLSNARKKKGRKGKRGRRAAAATGQGSSLRQLLAAKRLAARLGGIDAARQALDTLAKLLG